MKKKVLVIISLSLMLSGSAQNKTLQLDSIFTQLNSAQKFYGNVLIAEKGNVIYKKSFGKADRSKNTDLNEESMFELASVSKQFTAMGIMLLKKQGQLSYEDSLRSFFPELPYNNISVRQLLQHTSGMPDYIELFIKNWDSTKIATNKDLIRLLAQYKPPILFKPGDKWEYSNTGYALLASIIEQVSGMEFGEYMQKNIFIPLEMKRTMVYRRRYEKRAIDNYAYGYVMNNNKQFSLPDSLPQTAIMVYCLDGIVGDGTINSTTTDLLKWDRALYSDKLVSKKMLKEAFTPAVLNNGTSPYGFGWALGKIENAGQIVSHGGAWPGYATYIERHLETDKTIILLRNNEVSAVALQKIRNILYGIKEEAIKEITIDPAKLKQYAGEYKIGEGFSIIITTEKDKIFAQATGQEKFEIFAEKQDLFFLKVVDAKIKFLKDEKGVVNKLTLLQNGQVVPGIKIK